jgi:hypothetical protein
MKKVIVVSVLLLSSHGYSEVQKQGDPETFLSSETLENADRNFQEDLLKKGDLKPVAKKANFPTTDLDRLRILYEKRGKSLENPVGPDFLTLRDSSGREGHENKYAAHNHRAIRWKL